MKTKWARWFKVNGEDREFMYLYGAVIKQEVVDFLNEFSLHYNKGDLHRITKSKNGFELWDARV